MQKNNLLIEIVTEELPPLSQKDLGEAFAKNIAQLWQQAPLVCVCKCKKNECQILTLATSH